MRHRALSICVLLLLLLLALPLSGWGGVLAASLCAHGAGQETAMAEDHDCCRTRLPAQNEHCGADASLSTQASHDGMAMTEAEATPAVAAQANSDTSTALAQPAGECLHCVSRSTLPPSSVGTRAAVQKQRSAIITPPLISRPWVPLIACFSQHISTRRGAPPGMGPPLHLLFSALVI